MHGRPRKAPQPDDEAVSAAKAAKLQTLQSQVLHNHCNKIYDKEAVEVSAKLLEINPEFYSAWNYRKLAVEFNLSQSLSDPEYVQSILNEELKVVENALKQNFKSYGAWHHRKWVLSKGQSSLDHELRLLARFQKADPRNFHAWNYRRFVAALKNIPEDDELKYTTDMIERNFSNYSAWHNRSVLLSNLLKRRAEGFTSKEKILREEYELVHQAIFTDPDDQSGWFYLLWLLDLTVKQDAPALISCWPSSGSKIVVSTNSSSDSSILSPLGTDLSNTGTLPIILYFNEVVRGVNSSTVTVKSVFGETKDLIWRPLLATNCQNARAWVAHLKLSDMSIDPSITYMVEVNLGSSPDIYSLSGCHLSGVFQCKFSVCFEQFDPRPADRQDLQMISWEDCNYQQYDKEFQGFDPIPTSSKLKVDGDYEATPSNWKVDILAYEISLFRELLSEVNCKIGKLTLARLLSALDTMMLERSTSDSYPKDHTEEVLNLYSDLIRLDPTHLKYYEEEYNLVFLRKVTSSKETLLRHCWYFKDSASSDTKTSLCFRLNNLSLARIGSVEHLLWVQMLDLSHNELRSIEGLESMQLLSCLNLSNNKLMSFSALSPLRELRWLKALNISYNEIGEHSIDTTRYLYASPPSHTMEIVSKSHKSSRDCVKMMKYWEAFTLFKDLKLTQLDIAGNAVVDEDFTLFLYEVLPTLKWLDGKCSDKFQDLSV